MKKLLLSSTVCLAVILCTMVSFGQQTEKNQQNQDSLFEMALSIISKATQLIFWKAIKNLIMVHPLIKEE